MSSSDGYYDGLDEIYDDIDEPSDCYTSLNLVEPKEDEHDYTKIKRKEEEEEEDFPAEAPEPPPMREHMYLELVNLPWGSVLGVGRQAADNWINDITAWIVG